MNLPLRPKFQKFIDAKVESGQYASSQEVIEEALDQMRLQAELTQEDVQQLRVLLDKAIAQADRGEFVEFSAESVVHAARTALQQQRAG
jgi:antitoxin ParD1/3/4